MKKKYIIILIVIVFLITIGIIVLFNSISKQITKNKSISKPIINYYNKKEEKTFEIRLSDSKDSANFSGEKIRYNNENRYVLKPII